MSIVKADCAKFVLGPSMHLLAESMPLYTIKSEAIGNKEKQVKVNRVQIYHSKYSKHRTWLFTSNVLSPLLWPVARELEVSARHSENLTINFPFLGDTLPRRYKDAIIRCHTPEHINEKLSDKDPENRQLA